MGLSEPLRCGKGRWRVPPLSLCSRRCRQHCRGWGGGFRGPSIFPSCAAGASRGTDATLGCGKEASPDRRRGQEGRQTHSGQAPPVAPCARFTAVSLDLWRSGVCGPRLSPSPSYHLVFPGTAVPLPQAELTFKFQSCHCHWPPRPAVTLLSSSLG